MEQAAQHNWHKSYEASSLTAGLFFLIVAFIYFDRDTAKLCEMGTFLSARQYDSYLIAFHFIVFKNLKNCRVIGVVIFREAAFCNYFL